MTVRIKVETKGFAEYLERVAELSGDVDRIAGDALEAGAQILLDEMKERVPVLTRNLKDHLAASAVQQDANFVYVDVGILDADRDTAIYANVQEYGSTSNPAQPYIRPAFDTSKSRVRAAQKEVFQKAGVV